MAGQTTRISVRLDPVQLAWVEAIAYERAATRAAVVREAIRYFAARETVRVARTERYRMIGIIAQAERFDPIGDYLASDRELVA